MQSKSELKDRENQEEYDKEEQAKIEDLEEELRIKEKEIAQKEKEIAQKEKDYTKRKRTRQINRKGKKREFGIGDEVRHTKCPSKNGGC